MQQGHKPATAPLGFAFLFLSIAIIPFSLKAAGMSFGIHLPAAGDAFRQVASVFSGTYGAMPIDLLSSTEPSEPADSAHSCPEVIAQANATFFDWNAPQSLDAARANECPQVHRPVCRRSATPAIKALRSARLDLPLQHRVLADAFQFTPETLELPRVTVDLRVLRRQLERGEVREAFRKAGAEKTFKFLLSPAGWPRPKVPCPNSRAGLAPRNDSRVNPENPLPFTERPGQS